ncbi:MAG: hypothetical protein ACRDNY_09440 [Gaiellaceae bacterium]
MSERGPDFDDLIGSEVSSPERERLERVHDLLVAAGPPPELSGALSAPSTGASRLQSRRRAAALLALAAALGAVAFAVGFAVASSDGPNVDRVVAMTGASGVTASLEIFEIDDAGNWPMQLEVEGLGPSPDGRLYELWLTVNGAPRAFCGSFLAAADGTTVVPMNAPWKLDDFDGWVVVEHGSTTPVLTT